MKNAQTKTELKMLAMTAAIAMFVFLSNAVGVLQAADTPPGGGAPGYGSGAGSGAGGTGAGGAQETNLCVPEMDAYTQVELGRYREFLTTNFQNKSSTTSLLDLGMGRYREFRTALYKKYNSYFPKTGALQLTEGIVPSSCLDIVNKALAQARNELKTRSVQTSTVKKATALIHKYQDINNQLRVLNRTFVTMKAYLDTFATKLPCYIKKACNKG